MSCPWRCLSENLTAHVGSAEWLVTEGEGTRKPQGPLIMLVSQTLGKNKPSLVPSRLATWVKMRGVKCSG